MTAPTKDQLDKLVVQIKRDARRLVKAMDGDISHCRALERLSREHGFTSYAALLAARKAAP